MKRTFLTLILCASFSIGMMAQHSVGPGSGPSAPGNQNNQSLGDLPAGFAVAYDAWNNGFCSISNSSFTSVSQIFPSTNTFLAGDIGPGKRYFVADFNTYILYEVNFNSNSLINIGSITGMTSGHSITGMTYNSASGTMYFSSTNISTSSLYTINLSTGALTLISQITNCPAIIDIAINSSGHLYGIDIVNDNFLEINPSTGAGTIIGPLGFDANFAQDIEFDDQTGILYWATSGEAQQIRTINISNGTSTLVAPISTLYDCLAIASFIPVPVNKWAILSIFVLLMGVVSLRFFFKK